MRRLPPRIVPLIALIVVVIGSFLVLNSRKSTTSNASQTLPASASSNPGVTTSAVNIQGYAFSPAAITVKAGTTVTWTNQDAVRHSVSNSTNGSGPDSQLFGRGETYSYTYTTAGTYAYYCMPHPYMKGTVTVIQ